MDKVFLSADIEGTCGIVNWDETEHGKFGYDTFSTQMSREVSAACTGILHADGKNQILVRDAHDTARNIHPDLLPQVSNISLFRGWGRDPYAMMSGLDQTFTAAMFTGYHSAVSWDGNPLSHTMNTRNISIRLNGEIMSELMMNSLTAASFGVPVLMVTGDEMLCQWFAHRVPAAQTVAVSHAVGAGSIAMMPGEACRRIQSAAEKALSLTDRRCCLFPMPEYFCLEVQYRVPFDARKASWYPNAQQTDSRTIVFESEHWMDILTFIHFCV